MGAAELHEKVAAAFNAADIEALVALYEPDACMRRDDGTTASGLAEIREIWAGFVALGGRISLDTHYVIEAADITLLSNTWTFQGEGMTFSATTAEVARRTGEGSWRYVIDNPFASTDDAT